MADRGEHVVQHHARRDVVMHVAGGDERDARVARQLLKLCEARLVVGAVVQLGEEVAAVGEDVAVV